MESAEEVVTKKLGKGITVSISHAKNYGTSILRELINNKKALGVYLTTMQPYDRVVDWLKQENIEHSSLFFLDLAGKGGGENENVFVLRDPTDLTELSVVITEVMENESIEFLYIDRIGGLESYVDSASVKKFLQALIAYMKKLNKSLIIDYTGTESKELMSYILQISDYHKE